MKFCDVTMAYNARSGGIRTYIDEKRRYLREHTDHEHLLIIPGPEDQVERAGRETTVRLASPLLPGQDAYRFFLSARKLRAVLQEHAPDLVELGCYYVSPWAAFSHRRRRREAGGDCIVSAFFHTDVAEAYVAAPLHALAEKVSSTVAEPAGALIDVAADAAATAAGRYMREVFMGADLRFASAPAQVDRLTQYGVSDVKVSPLGVDLELFHPSRRSRAVRATCGAKPEDLVLVYAGRFSTEKRVHVILDALASLPPGLRVRTWMIGDGPLRAELEARAAQDNRISLFSYESDRERFAALLASADIYVSAGPHETFGLSVIEAQASGLPVAGVAAGALVERVPDGLGVLAEMDDPADLARAIAEAAVHRKAMGRAGRRHVEQRFSWTASFEPLIAQYEAAVAKAPAARSEALRRQARFRRPPPPSAARAPAPPSA